MIRLISFVAAYGRAGVGLATTEGVIDLTARRADMSTIGTVLTANLQDELSALADGAPDLLWDQIEYRAPVAGADKIICVGINYPARAEEYRTGPRDSDYPNLFIRFGRSFVGHDQPLVRPTVSKELDYEGEIVLVVGRGGRHIRVADALAHVGGVTIGNEGTIRDWVAHGSRNVTQGKNFDSSGSIGPWVIPTADLDLSRPLSIETRVNGTVRQKDSTHRLLWGFAELIEYVSTFTTLAPGDLLFTGTPTGSGSHAKPPLWLAPGDVVEVEVGGIGVLRNSIADEGRADRSGADEGGGMR
jgi:2-keto-4-pentenoate hydratase/2-oxohepta-3-ene-1,7-dioic acid hydratase in catechol pathway